MDLKITIIDIQNQIIFHQIIDLTIALKNFFGNTIALTKFLENNWLDNCLDLKISLTPMPRNFFVAQLTWQLPWQLFWKNNWLDNCLDLKKSLTPMPRTAPATPGQLIKLFKLFKRRQAHCSFTLCEMGNLLEVQKGNSRQFKTRQNRSI